MEIKPIDYKEYNLNKVNIKLYDYESGLIYLKKVFDNIKTYYNNFYIILKKKLLLEEHRKIFETILGEKKISLVKINDIIFKEIYDYKKKFFEEHIRKTGIKKKEIKDLYKIAIEYENNYTFIMENLEMIKKIFLLENLMDDDYNLLIDDSICSMNLTDRNQYFDSIFNPPIINIDNKFSIDLYKFDEDKYKNILDEYYYGLYDYLKSFSNLKKEFSKRISDIFIEKIIKMYEHNDIIYLCIAPGNRSRIPLYLEELMTRKKIGIIYIQDSENALPNFTGNILAGFTPFWKNEKTYLSKLNLLNKKIKDKLEVLIIEKYFDAEYVLGEVNKIINKKTLFYLGFSGNGSINFKSGSGKNIFELFCNNENVLIIGPNGYVLPKGELVEIIEPLDQKEKEIRNQINSLTYDEETNNLIIKFLETDVDELNEDGGNYKIKYLKYKQKYLKLKLNMNLQ
jgi:hypothetical protein